MKFLTALTLALVLAPAAFAQQLPQNTFCQQLPQCTFVAAECDCANTGICTCPICDCDDGLVIFGKCGAKMAARKAAKQQNNQSTFQSYAAPQAYTAMPQTYQSVMAQTAVWQEWQNGWQKNLATGEWKHGNYGVWPAGTTWESQGYAASQMTQQYVPQVYYQQPAFQFYGGYGGACANGACVSGR